MRFDIALVAYVPGGARLGLLPTPLSINVAAPMNDMPALTLKYPASGPGADALAGPVEIAVEVLNPRTGVWTEPPQMRFLRLSWNADKTDPLGVTTYTCPGLAWLLNKVVTRPPAKRWVTPEGGGPNSKPVASLVQDKSRAFASASAGTIVGTLFQEAVTRGNRLPGFSRSFTSGADSNSAGWAKVLGAYEVNNGAPLLRVLDNLSDQGLCDWRTNGRALELFNPDGSMAIDRTANVTLLSGADIDKAPDKGSLTELVSNVLFLGDEGLVFEMNNPSSPTPWGVWESAVSQGGVSQEATGRMLGQATLDNGAQERIESTRSLLINEGGVFPFIDYGVGDFINAPGPSGGIDRMRVRQITLARNEKGEVDGNIVLNDRFVERSLREARKTAGILGGTSAGGNNVQTAPPIADDKRVPAPANLTAVTPSVVIGDQGQTNGYVHLDWSHSALSTTGTLMDLESFTVFYLVGTAWRSLGEFAGTARSADVGPLRVLKDDGTDAAYAMVVMAKATNEKTSTSNQRTVTMVSDVTAPAVPKLLAADVTTEMRTATVRWTGKGIAGGLDVNMPTDFDYINVYQNSSSGAAGRTKVGEIRGVSIWTSNTLPADVPVWYTLTSVDFTGNESAHSSARTVTPTANVDMSKFFDHMDAAKVALTNVGSESIKAGAILAEKLAKNAVSLEKLDEDVQARVQEGADALAAIGPLQAEAASTGPRLAAAEGDLAASKDRLDSAEGQLTNVFGQLGTVDSRVAAAKSAALTAAAADATAKKEQAEANAATAAAGIAQTKADAAQAAALAAAKTYADVEASGAGAEALAAAKADATSKADAAKAAAIAAAALDATAKKEQAEANAAADAKTKADAALAAAKADATSKANAAQAAAIAAAAADATAKKEQAEAAAATAAAGIAQTKADAAQAAALAAAKTYADAQTSGASASTLASAKADATSKADAAKAAAIAAAALDATAKKEQAEAAAALDATAKADAALEAARFESISAQAYNLNPSFDDWTGSLPAKYGGWGSVPPTKETSTVRRGQYALRFDCTDTTTERGMSLASGTLGHAPGNVEYWTVEMAFQLVSGTTLSGSGVLLDWSGMTGSNRVSLRLDQEIPSPVTGKWYTISTTVQRPAGANGTGTGMAGYLMGNYGSGLGPRSVKDLVIDWLNIRPASAEEINAGKALTMAGSKSRVYYNTSTASGEATAYGDLWRQVDASNNIIAEWRWSGSAWVKTAISSEAISNVDIGKLTAGSANMLQATIDKLVANTAAFQQVDVRNLFATSGTMDSAVITKLWADVVNAKKITTDMLLVGKGGNLINWIPGDTSLFMSQSGGGGTTFFAANDSDAGGACIRVHVPGLAAGPFVYTAELGSGATAANGQANAYEIVPNEPYRFEMRATAGGNTEPGATTWPTMRVMVRFFNGANASLGDSHYTAGAGKAAYGGTPVVWEGVAPATAVAARIYIQQDQPSGNIGHLYLSMFNFSRKVSSVLIADGAVTADKVNAQDVAGAVGSFIELNVSQLNATSAGLDSAVIDKLWTDVVTSRKITTGMLAVSDLTNFAPSLAESPDDWSTSGGMQIVGTGVDPSGQRFNASSTPSTAWAHGPVVAVQPGEELYGKAQIYRTSGNTTTVFLRYYWYDKDMAAVGAYASADSSGGSVALTAKVPSGAAYARYTLAILAVPSGQSVGPWGMSGRRMSGGELLVDGAVTAKHLTVTDEMWAKVINFKLIKGDDIDTNHLASDTGFIGVLKTKIVTADSVTSVNIHATNGITSKHTITGAKFQTTASSNRGVEFSTAGIKAWNSGGYVSFNLDAASGNVYAAGSFQSGSSQSGVILDESVYGSRPGVRFNTGIADQVVPSIHAADSTSTGYAPGALIVMGSEQTVNSTGRTELVISPRGAGFDLATIWGPSTGKGIKLVGKDMTINAGDLTITSDTLRIKGKSSRAQTATDTTIYGLSATTQIAASTYTLTYSYPVPSGKRYPLVTPDGVGPVGFAVQNATASGFKLVYSGPANNNTSFNYMSTWMD